MDEKGINKEELFRDMIGNFFFKYLPFAVPICSMQFVYKIFIIYLNEGVKIFFRVVYSLMKHWRELILQTTTIDKLKQLIQ